MSRERNKAWKRSKREVEKEINQALQNELNLNAVQYVNPLRSSENDIPASTSNKDNCVGTVHSELNVAVGSSCSLELLKVNLFDPDYLVSEDEVDVSVLPATGSSSHESMDEIIDTIDEFEYEILDDLDIQIMRMKFTEETRMSSEDVELLKSFFEDDPEKDDPESVLKADLVVWSLQNKIGRNALTHLLHILIQNNHPHLSKSSKTLMKTPRSTVHLFKTLEHGVFWYYGILNCLLPRLTEDFMAGLIGNEILIDVFVDGVSPYKSVKQVLWPICGCIAGTDDIFIIAMWCGTKKDPGDQNVFFDDFIAEAAVLMKEFSHRGKNLILKIKRIIADAPARTWVKNVNQHGSYDACDRCTAVGQWIGNRITYHPKEDTQPRTDQSLADRSDRKYHKGMCPLTQVNIKLISQMPLEPMHLVYLGVMKRIMDQVLRTYRNTCQYKFSDELKREIDILSKHISQFYPSEFARKPREWTDFKLFKATEFRRIVLYDGFILLKTEGVSKKVFINFLLFACAIRILSDPELVKEFANDAKILLEKFIENSVKIYKQTFNVYNVHHLKHLTEECKRHGHLECFSAFMYENYLGVLKRLLHAPGRTLSQIVCRLMEQVAHMPKPARKSDEIQVSIPCDLPMALKHLGQGFKKITIPQKKMELSTESFFLSSEKKVVMVSHIIKTAETYLVAGNSFEETSNYFMYPVASSVVGIYKVNKPKTMRQTWTVNEITKKCLVMPIPSVRLKPINYHEGPCIALTLLHGG